MRSILVLFLSAALAGPVVSQGVPAFSYVMVGGGPQPDFREEDGLRKWWLFESDGEAFIATPTIWGQIEFGGAIHRFLPRSENLPEFDAVLAYVGLDTGIRYPKGVRLAAGPRVGMYFMGFDIDGFAGAKNEAEMTIGAHARLTVQPVSFVGLYASVAYMQTFTHVRLKMRTVSGGMILNLTSPGWLRRMLE